MATFRILSCTTIPNFMHKWILEKIISKEASIATTNGDAGTCFEMWDITLRFEGDAIEFKRRFGGAIFTPIELEQSNSDVEHNPGGEFWRQKFNAYQDMREKNNEHSFR